MMRGGRFERLLATARRLESWGDRRGWAGPDPYDALNATRLLSPLRRRPRSRQAVTQLVKRSPLDLRPLLGVPRGRDSATYAHVAAAYARNGFLPEGEARTKLGRALAALDELRAPGYEEPCWGYHFDVQTRFFFYPRGTPNTIATAFVGLSLLDVYEATGEQEVLGRAEGAAEFFLRRVPQTDSSAGAYFGYLAGDRTAIHNANLLVCALLARVGSATGRADLLERAEAGVRYAVAHQRRDGSWPYAERAGHDWVDGYHTGYVLQCLLACRKAGVPAARSGALEHGLEFYRRELFLADGTPKFLATSVYPIDVECVAEGIRTFAEAAALATDHLEQAWTVFEFAWRRMRRSDGAFLYQRRRLWSNRTAHVRWGQAPMLAALTCLLAAEQRVAQSTA